MSVEMHAISPNLFSLPLQDISILIADFTPRKRPAQRFANFTLSDWFLSCSIWLVPRLLHAHQGAQINERRKNQQKPENENKNAGYPEPSFKECCGPGCLSWIRIFQIPDSRSRVKSFPDPGSASASKNLSILTQKIVSKLSEIWSKMFILGPDPGSGSWFFTHPGSRI